jgi:hypothetical protein
VMKTTFPVTSNSAGIMMRSPREWSNGHYRSRNSRYTSGPAASRMTGC